MQSLQIRCPVAAQSGLSTATIASAPIAVAARLDDVHLRDLLVERAAGQRYPEHAFAEAAVLVVQARAAAVLLLVVAPDAVIRLVERAGEIGAGVGQAEPVTRPPIVFRQTQHRDAVPHDRFGRHEVVHVEPVRHPEQQAAPVPGASGRGQRRPGGIFERGAQRQLVRGLVLEPARDGIRVTQLPREHAGPRREIGWRAADQRRRVPRRAWGRSDAPPRPP